MASFEFDPLARFIYVKWKCPKCGCENCSDAITPPTPDFSAETNHDSIESDGTTDICAQCDHEVEINLYTGMWSADGDIDVDEENFLGIEEEQSEFAEDYYDPEQYAVTKTETEKMLDAIEPLDSDVKAKLYQLLYANIISKMETFLNDTIVKYVMENEERKRHFVQTYQPLATQNFPMSSIFDKYKSLDSIIRNALAAIVYHDLKLVNKLYESNTGIPIDPCKEIKDAIVIRHDIVHRNGKDKDGNTRVITKEDVTKLANVVENFIFDIDAKVTNVEAKDIFKTLGIDI